MIIGFYFGTQSQKKAAPAAGGYIGAQQGTVMGESAEPVYETVDAAVSNDVHPPDGAVAKVGFEH